MGGCSPSPVSAGSEAVAVAEGPAKSVAPVRELPSPSPFPGTPVRLFFGGGPGAGASQGLFSEALEEVELQAGNQS